jgi:hypothetical protein
VARRVLVDPPRNRFTARPGPGRDVLSGELPARCDDAFVRSGEVTDQDVKVDDRLCSPPRRTAVPGAGNALERQPLAMWRRLQRYPAGIPLDWRRVQEPGPERGQLPGIGAVQHDLAYPPDRAVVAIAHQSMMSDVARRVRHACVKRAILPLRARSGVSMGSRASGSGAGHSKGSLSDGDGARPNSLDCCARRRWAGAW